MTRNCAARTTLTGALAALFLAACGDDDAGTRDAGERDAGSEAEAQSDTDGGDASVMTDGDDTPDGEVVARAPIACKTVGGDFLPIEVPAEQQCNGVRDCFGSEDEIDCPGIYVCPGPYSMNEPFVLAPEQLCDGHADCINAADERECDDLEQFFCTIDEPGAIGVYTQEERCNLHAFCFYGEDEQNCPDSFVCPTNCFGQVTVVPSSVVCDGKWDCTRDELDCPGAIDPFVCDDGRAVPGTALCDDRYDCLDGSDQNAEHCPDLFECNYVYVECTPPESSAERIYFIAAALVCDGKSDCRYGADERDCE